MSYSNNGRITNKTQTAEIRNANGSSSIMNIDNDYLYSSSSQPNTLTEIEGTTEGFSFDWDPNGNMTIFRHTDSLDVNTRRFQCWDEENRLFATSDGDMISHYIYDAGGERAIKYTGNTSHVQINKYTTIDYAIHSDYTYYVNPLFVVGTNDYTKHYFAEGTRIMSKIGAGMQNSLIGIHAEPDGIDLNDKAQAIVSQFENNLECLELPEYQTDYSFNMEWINEMATLDDEETDLYFYHPDHLGSSTFITDASGSVDQHLEYLAFGELFIEERDAQSWNTPFKFSAKEKDVETGLSYFGARYYDPNISIWLSVDPVTSDLPSFSPYTYCYNNPIGYVDDWGLWGKRKAERKHERAVKKYGDENVGAVYKNDDGEYGFRISKTGFKQATGKDIPEGSDAHADAGTAVFNRGDLKNFEMFGYDAGATGIERTITFMTYLGLNAIDFWSDFNGGPSGPDATLSDKAYYLALLAVIGKIGLPTEGTYQYKAPKRWKNKSRLPTAPRGGFLDELGNVWTRPRGSNIQGELHWDVTLSRRGQQRWGTQESHLNINNNGEICH